MSCIINFVNNIQIPDFNKINSYSFNIPNNYLIKNNHLISLNDIKKVILPNNITLIKNLDVCLDISLSKHIITNTSIYEINNINLILEELDLNGSISFKSTNSCNTYKIIDKNINIKENCGLIVFTLNLSIPEDIFNVCEIMYNLSFNKLKLKILNNNLNNNGNNTNNILNGLNMPTILYIKNNIPPVEILFGTLNDICVNQGLVYNLSGGTPSGGIYSGIGVIDNGDGTFNFNSNGNAGTFIITYSIGSVSSTSNILVKEPIVSFSSLNNICIIDTKTDLTGGLPIGGVYTGTGVTDNGNGETFTFTSPDSNIDSYTITYTYTDNDGCIGSSTSNITTVLPTYEKVIAILDTSYSVRNNKDDIRDYINNIILKMDERYQSLIISKFDGDNPTGSINDSIFINTSVNLGISGVQGTTISSSPDLDTINSIGYTNWESSFKLIVDNITNMIIPEPDLILFFTDGNPTTAIGQSSNGSPSQVELDTYISQTVAQKDLLPLTTRIIGVIIGTQSIVDNLCSPAGCILSNYSNDPGGEPQENIDYYLDADFGNLANIGNLVDLCG